MNGGNVILHPEQSGLYFYRFEIDTWRGTLGITSRFGGEKAVSMSSALLKESAGS